jgi:hypothetical protein
VVVVTEFVLSGLQPSVTWLPGLAQLRDLAGASWAVKAIEATVAGDAGAWWRSVAAMLGLTLLSAVATTILVARAHRLRLPEQTLGGRIAAACHGLRNEESTRLVAVGVRSLAAVAAVVVGLHVVAVGAHGQQRRPVMAAAANQAPARADLALASTPPAGVAAILNAGGYLPGAVGQAWNGMQTGLLLIEATSEAAASS